MKVADSAQDAFRTLVLNPASVFVAMIATVLMRCSGTSFLVLLNPWEVSLLLWVVGYAAVRLSLLGFVDGLVWIVGPWLPPLPSRVGPKPVFQHKINFLDVTYLAINSIIEYVFAMNIFFLLWHSPFIVRAPSSLGVLNGIVAFWLLLIIDDSMYAPLHRFMHHHYVYRWVHKHHHRNTFPARGYIDAANEHPVEQIAALTLHWIAVHVVTHIVGLHVVTVGAHFGFKALGACFNHTGFDLRFKFLGIDYSVRAHETHHRKPQTNFAQYVMFWDRLMGTYQKYESGHARREHDPTTAPQPKAEPNRLPAWADPAVEAMRGEVIESKICGKLE
eukprot:CAMPEP_0119330216 /NCGR_PEP_ID=MMETSP1333-20130426/77782_1 /TAXON_ID=418940 /ORGANISM="Scyphosphaera apsteinii, Strain RCC1455" /LENGTH=331 /DNA_ID=CAMNT_0007339557 /DNA_START=18 /DNA_END=1013 /DNA_ORIENTATION=+